MVFSHWTVRTLELNLLVCYWVLDEVLRKILQQMGQVKSVSSPGWFRLQDGSLLMASKCQWQSLGLNTTPDFSPFNKTKQLPETQFPWKHECQRRVYQMLYCYL